MKIVITKSQFNRIIEEASSPADVRVERLKENFLTNFDSFMSNHSSGMSQANKFYDTQKIIDKLKNFILSKIPQYAWGGDGAKWAKELSDFIYKCFVEEIQKITWFQKQQIKLLSGGKNNFIETASNVDYYRDLDTFLRYVCALIYDGNFDRDFTGWFSDNFRLLIGKFVKTAADKIYS